MENPTSEVTVWDWDWDWEEVGLPSSPSSAASHGCAALLRSDYFSPDYAADVDEDEGQGSESDNPSWVDPTEIAAVDVGGRSSSDDDSVGINIVAPHSECCGAGFCDEKPSEIGEKCDEVKELGFPAVEEVENREEEEEEEEKKREVVWWRAPLEVIKYCVVRVSPVWSLSMAAAAAAALMGFVILRRRYLYKLKRKSLGIHLNAAIDDKKVSQFMSRAARLNEAFSVVKRVPIIRPALPAPGMALWPVVSLR